MLLQVQNTLRGDRDARFRVRRGPSIHAKCAIDGASKKVRSRILSVPDGREVRSAHGKAYYKGLNLLLNEQHDKAIDAFIEAVQQDPDTSDLHFALGKASVV